MIYDRHQYIARKFQKGEKKIKNQSSGGHGKVYLPEGKFFHAYENKLEKASRLAFKDQEVADYDYMSKRVEDGEYVSERVRMDRAYFEKPENLKNYLMDEISFKKRGTTKQLSSLMDSIAFHESKYTAFPDNNYTPKQIGGGPGRGVYQFETSKGSNDGLISAKRLKNYLTKIDVVIPKWVDRLSKQDSVDASMLSKDQQDLLFLGKYMEHPTANLANVFSGRQSQANFWGKYHNAGASPNIEGFNNDNAALIKIIKEHGKISDVPKTIF